jgi:organic hydroperoxide reductase OsmC/OhrA
MLEELEDVRLAAVEDVDDTTDELEVPVEADDEIAELEEPADLFCTVANVVPTNVDLLLGSMAL